MIKDFLINTSVSFLVAGLIFFIGFVLFNAGWAADFIRLWKATFVTFYILDIIWWIIKVSNGNTNKYNWRDDYYGR